jgi:hypothetical protein
MAAMLLTLHFVRFQRPQFSRLGAASSNLSTPTTFSDNRVRPFRHDSEHSLTFGARRSTAWSGVSARRATKRWPRS